MVKYTQTNCLGVFDHFVELALKGLIKIYSGENNFQDGSDIIIFKKRDFARLE